MKNIKFYCFIGTAFLFAACSDDFVPVAEPADPQIGHILDLKSMDYNKLSGVLSSLPSSGNTILFQNGVEIWDAFMKPVHGIEIEECGYPASLFESNDQDSVSAILSQNYVTIRLQRYGEIIDYIAYKDKGEMTDIVNCYQNRYFPIGTGTADGIIVCNSGADTYSCKTDIKNVRINITKAINNAPGISSGKGYPAENMDITYKNSILSSIRFVYPVTLEFMLIKEKDGGAFAHDITSQIQSATTSMEFLINSGFITVKYTIKESAHQGISDYEVGALESFQRYLRTWEEVNGQGKKPYILLRDGTWNSGSTLGYASGIGVIHLNNPRDNFEVAALSTTSSLYPYTLAHEIGHLLGAEHVNNKQDLMYPGISQNVTPNHLSADNQVRILESIQK